MTTKEADHLVLYLLSPFPSEVAKLNEAAFLVWRDVLTVFPVAVGQEAGRTFFANRAAFQVGKAPTPDEFARAMDQVWKAQDQEAEQERRQDAKLGWRQIEDKTRDDVGKATLPLILAYLDGKIDKAAYVVGVRDLDRRFPGLGFAASADQVEGVTP